jgi:hypothetical protein
MHADTNTTFTRFARLAGGRAAPRRSIVAVAAMAFLLAACGSGAAPGGTSTGVAAADSGSATGGQSAAPDQAIDVCGLLTHDEIKQATGHGVKSQEADTGGGLSRAPGCTWVLDTGSDMDLAGIHSISIDVTRPGGRSKFDFLAGLPTVSGIGDGAKEMGGNIGGDVWAVKGDALVHLSYALPADVTDADPLVLPLVKLALSKV